MIIMTLAVVLIVVVVTSCGGQTERGSQKSPEPPPEGVKSFEVSDHPRHVEGDVDYPQTPPVGGDHSPVWQNCGFYKAPIDNEKAVHSMEHGAVWITYRPNLPQKQQDKLRELASGQTYVLASPFSNLPKPVVASAWGKQLRLDGADDPRLKQFVRAFREGPQTPEHGARCTGGAGEPA
jgi:Protein of unknown function (DUF3105)